MADSDEPIKLQQPDKQLSQSAIEAWLALQGIKASIAEIRQIYSAVHRLSPACKTQSSSFAT